jgi:hypothetical protein
MSVNDHQELYPMIRRKPFFLVKQFSLKCLGMISDILLPNQSLKGTAGREFFFLTILNTFLMVCYEILEKKELYIRKQSHGPVSLKGFVS